MHGVVDAEAVAHKTTVGAANRAWVAAHAMFGPAVARFVDRLQRA